MGNEAGPGTEGKSDHPVSAPYLAGSGASGEDFRDPIVTQQRGHIPIPLDEVPDAKDQIPTLTPKMTTASDSLILSNILATIAQEEVRYVGIVATDVLDTLFLAGMIREHYPDVQIILVGADLRYTDLDFSLDFRGTIVGSSYPLDPLYQRWCYPFQGEHDRRLFLTDLDMGTYNAALVLLNAEQTPGGKQLVFHAKKEMPLLAYGGPPGMDMSDNEKRPGMWINQVGQRNLWPLKFTSMNEQLDLIPAVADVPAGPPAHRPDQSVLNLPLLFKLVAMLLSGFGLLLARPLGLAAGPGKHAPQPSGSSTLGFFASRGPCQGLCVCHGHGGGHRCSQRPDVEGGDQAVRRQSPGDGT